MMKALSLIVAICLLTTSCATTSIIDDPYGSLSREEFLTARGYGPTAEKAELNAKVELASLFGSAVKSVTARTIAENKKGYDESFIKASEIVIDTEDLYGIEIAKTVKGKDGSYTSVAMMDKASAVTVYKAQQADMLDSLKSLEADKPLSDGSLASLEKAVSYCRLAEKYNKYVSIINYLEGSEIPFYDKRIAESVYSSASDSICLEISIVGDDTGRVESTVAEILTGFGLKLSGGSEMPTAITEGRIDFRQVQGTGVASDFVFAEFDAEIRLRDLVSDRTVFAYSTHGREGHQSYESAKSRALSVIEKEIKAAFNEQISEVFSI